MNIYADKINIKEFGPHNILSLLISEGQNVIHLPQNHYKLKVCFSENEDFNAAAYEIGTRSWINISLGCAKQIFHHALILMGRPELLSEAGSEEIFEGSFLISEFMESEIIKYDEKYKQLVFYVGPDNPERQKVAELITLFALEFLMFHEMGHHLGGHIRYLSQEMGLTTLYAHGNDRTVDSQFYQMIETDADALAVSTLLESISTKMDHYIQNFLNGNKNLIPKCIIVAITLVFFLLPQDNEVELSESLYLPRNVRFVLCLDILFDKLETDYKICMSDQKKEDLLREYKTAHMLLQQLYRNTEKGALETDLKKEYQRYYKETVLPHWKIIREKLVPYAALNLPK